ncbi:uncharacterized protein CC84DRAFT_455591 [Paraphaeosphaeria sporulosa]|uniref:Uncharacterized protein n=1 Tax=Paraphaeosphaeria sporulosa TaxID=1460663 RepID=A0A177CSZ0_9PLEO|nr:uncharacterized protein CC84DRAFT_455591 [Paraphaeosphaeria sporulosa]OAG09859.1 hypothetical protein CC84DRAFT_455591 [Paraphaeosphaeria sporulosa]
MERCRIVHPTQPGRTPEHTSTMAETIDRNMDDKMEFSTSKEVTVAPTTKTVAVVADRLFRFGRLRPTVDITSVKLIAPSAMQSTTGLCFECEEEFEVVLLFGQG